mmetsp:Transcript_56964/g.185102  ORF Transcript_56964/g.185102 Transcript_56964/m.185102 type:complete len:631 (+) Transcript_56964:136-2028(+)
MVLFACSSPSTPPPVRRPRKRSSAGGDAAKATVQGTVGRPSSTVNCPLLGRLFEFLQKMHTERRRTVLTMWLSEGERLELERWLLVEQRRSCCAPPSPTTSTSSTLASSGQATPSPASPGAEESDVIFGFVPGILGGALDTDGYTQSAELAVQQGMFSSEGRCSPTGQVAAPQRAAPLSAVRIGAEARAPASTGLRAAGPSTTWKSLRSPNTCVQAQGVPGDAEALPTAPEKRLAKAQVRSSRPTAMRDESRRAASLHCWSESSGRTWHRASVVVRGVKVQTRATQDHELAHEFLAMLLEVQRWTLATDVGSSVSSGVFAVGETGCSDNDSRMAGSHVTDVLLVCKVNTDDEGEDGNEFGSRMAWALKRSLEERGLQGPTRDPHCTFIVNVSARCWIGGQLQTPRFHSLADALAARRRLLCGLPSGRSREGAGTRTDLVLESQEEHDAAWAKLCSVYIDVCAQAGRRPDAVAQRLAALRRPPRLPPASAAGQPRRWRQQHRAAAASSAGGGGVNGRLRETAARAEAATARAEARERRHMIRADREARVLGRREQRCVATEQRAERGLLKVLMLWRRRVAARHSALHQSLPELPATMSEVEGPHHLLRIPRGLGPVRCCTGGNGQQSLVGG